MIVINLQKFQSIISQRSGNSAQMCTQLKVMAIKQKINSVDLLGIHTDKKLTLYDYIFTF